MRIPITLIGLCFVFISFRSEIIKVHKKSILHSSMAKELVEDFVNSINKYEKNQDSIDINAYMVTDYLHLFELDKDLNDFINLDSFAIDDQHHAFIEAHKAQTYIINYLDHSSGFFSFRTANTPPHWDGDSKAELEYEITYWNLTDSSRFIALNITESTWVNDETIATSFFTHDQKGIEKVQWDSWTWNLGDFIGQEYESNFDKEMWANPPVMITLPQKGKAITVTLAFSEYMDNQKAYDLFHSLDIESSTLKFNPIRDFYDKNELTGN